MSIDWNGETLTFSTPLSEIEQGVYNTFKESFAKQERERIIKLLEANKKWCNADAYADMGCDCPWHLAIALIKGENE